MKRLKSLFYFFIIYFVLSCSGNQEFANTNDSTQKILSIGMEFYKDPNNQKIAYNYVDSLIKEKFYVQAYFLLKNEFPKHFKKDNLYYERLFHSAKNGKLYNHALEIDSSLVPDFIGKIELINLMDSILQWNNLIHRYPNNPKLYNKRGEAFYTIKEWEAADYDFSQAIKANPNSFEFIYNQLTVLFAKRNYKKAFNELENIKTRQGTFSSEELEVFEKMRKVLKDIVGIEDNTSLSEKEKHFEKAKILIAMKDYELAANEITISILKDKNYGDAYALRAFIYYQQAKLEEALADIELAEKITGKKDTPLSKMIRNKIYN